ncbi:T9SS type B sorting domain-containing protein [Flavobacterium sp. HJJ]|uniref:Ig-like domain-containing protein n=1 Tax=Flavobacterium sp. HJJ TaxID=2783792 RepID=UPI00188B8E28|nr:T9SS type B sorting domain-containing protein [Flavobacterium sp. HJJ]MBF4472894.1 T9SS type B sorting domain-containing protein [Flavobacterium sp. HJJ]
MKKAFILIFYLLSFSIYSQYTLIPDINFEKTLISQGIDNGIPDGKVLTASIDKIKILNISKPNDYYNKIKDLTGIQDFLELQDLDCSNNELTSLNMSKNLALTTLNCSNNLLSGLDISKNVNLSDFECSNNKFTTLDVSNNLNLVLFFCDFNYNLKTLDVSNNLKLKILYAGYNQFTNLDVTKNINLEFLSCAFSKLINLDLSKNINLIGLNCIYNSLTTLDVSKNIKLVFLDCTNNLLISLNLKNGNNSNLRYNSIDLYKPNSSFKSNPNLLCISVDDTAYSNANWSNLKDASASYTTTENLAPVISSPHFFCTANNQTLSDLTITSGTNLTWYNASSGGNTLPSTTALVDGEIYYASQNSGGCESTRTPVKVFIGDSQPPIPTLLNLPDITGDCHTLITTIPTATDACAGMITATTASSISYNMPGTYTVIWNYSDGNGNSISQNQKVIISAQPLPIITSPQTFCTDQNKILNDIIISTGISIKWYDSITKGNSLQGNSLLTNGSTYYASQTINGCESERTSVTVTIHSTLAPTGDAKQSFCTSQNPTLSNLVIVGTAIRWYDSSILGNLLTDSSPLSNGKTYYASQTVNNCESPRFGVTVSIINTPSAPAGNANQAFCKKENANLSDIQTSGQNIKWYDSNTSTTVLPNTALLENNKTYFASQTIGCESDRTPILIQLNDTPAPTGNSSQQFCIDNNATIANLNIIGTAVKWYDAVANGNLLSSTILLQNGTYYTTQTLNNCESGRFPIIVKIQDTQSPTADSPQTFCIQKNTKISNINIIGENIKWYESSTSLVSLTTSTLLADGITYYASQTSDNCESDRIPITVDILKANAGDCISLAEGLPYPKFFTPNNDGYNDSWTIDFAYLAPNAGIRIFDRYGKFIKELNQNGAWDGTYLGQTLPATDYWFTVTQKNGKEFRGHFSLKR